VRAETARDRDHPSLQALALYSKADLGWAARWKIGRHVHGCADCEEQISQFRSVDAEMKREAEGQLLTGFDASTHWVRLEREMIGNIAVGVAASRCIEKVGRGRVLTTRGVWLAVGFAVLFLAAWYTNIPSEQKHHLAASIRRSVGLEVPQISGTTVRTTPQGIAVRAQGATLTILHPPSAVISLAGRSSLRARFVDEETGEVTITNVYGD